MSRTQIYGAIANHQGESGHDYAYNMGKGLRKWRAELARLDSGTSEVANLCVLGDSITEGGMAGASEADYPTKGYVGLIRAALAAKYEDMGAGLIPTFHPHGSLLWTCTGTWAETTGYGVANYYEKTSANGDTATLAFNGTGIGIVVVCGAAGGTMDLTVDGGGEGSYDTYKVAPSETYIHEITGLEAGDHTLVITANLTAEESLYLVGAHAIKGTKGVRVHMAGRWSATSNLLSGTNAMAAEIGIFAPKLTIVGVTANDCSNQVAMATYAANLQKIITKALTYGDCMLASVGARNASYTIPQTAYVEAMKQLGLQNGIAYLDIYDRWNGGAGADAVGFLADNIVHPNSAGHKDMATAILAHILE